MSLYTLILFAHILGVLGLFVALSLEWLIQRQLRRATTADQAREWLATYRGLQPLTGGSGAVILFAGFYLAAQGGGSGAPAGWIAVGLLGLVAIGILGAALTGPRLAALRRMLPTTNQSLSAPDRARLSGDQMLVLSFSTRTLIALACVLVMTTKPDMTLSLAVLAVALVVGLFVPFLLPRGSARVELASPVD